MRSREAKNDLSAAQTAPRAAPAAHKPKQTGEKPGAPAQPTAADPGSGRSLRKSDYLIATLVGGLAFAVLAAKINDVGVGRDEALYMVGGETYWHWMEGADFSFAKMRKQKWLDRHYRYNAEHPPLVKHLAGLSWRLFHKCDCKRQAGLHRIAGRPHRYKKNHTTLGLLSEIAAFRLPTVVLTSLLVALLYLFGAATMGRLAGLAAALFYLLMPRVFFHSRLAALDGPVTAMIFFAVYAYWKSLHQARWALAGGLIFGLALATKLNAFFLPLLFAVHYAWASRRYFRNRGAQAAGLLAALPLLLCGLYGILALKTIWGLVLASGSLVLLWLLRGEADSPLFGWKKATKKLALLLPATFWAQVILGLAVLYFVWPYLWPDPTARFQTYLNYHLHHVFYNTEYFGRNYNLPPFPISFPFVMTAITVPGLTLLFALGGLGSALQPALAVARRTIDKLRCKVRGRHKPSSETSDAPKAHYAWETPAAHTHFDDTPNPGTAPPPKAGFWRPLHGTSRSPYFLIGLFALFPIVLIALPATPIFGGTRTWMPAMPFLALLAGLGLSRLVTAFVRALSLQAARTRNLVAAAAVVVAVLPGLCQTLHAADLAPSYYTPIIGGTRGGADLGMKRQYWGYTSRQMLSYFNANLTPPHVGSAHWRSRARRRTRLYLHDTIYLARDLYVRDGLLSPQIRASGGEYGGIRSSQHALFQYEKHQVMWEFTIWQEYNTFQPTAVLTLDGVPLLNHYGPKAKTRRTPNRMGPPYFFDPPHLHRRTRRNRRR
jgi:4-amino-4-deoxy-L-arabinose transferase-like glycosyltransferase